ncbi:MAG: Holliday junction resolvase RuvX [Corynebacterium sp.]|nr:Holliday junction resolvase RuvX [Corynebacterium sp.]
MAKITPDVPGHGDPGSGRRLALDIGTVRIGVAVSDRDAVMAMPVETIPRATGLKDSDGADIAAILQLIHDYQVVEVVVGLPRDLKGNGSKSVRHAKDIAFRIRRRLEKPFSEDPAVTSPPVVRMGDERLTTVVASAALRASGINEKKGRSVIDQAAAVEILQSWLDGRQSYLQRAAECPEVVDGDIGTPE